MHEDIRIVCAAVRRGTAVAVLVVGSVMPPWSDCTSPWNAAHALAPTPSQAVVDPKPARPSRLPDLHGVVLPGIESTEPTTIAGQVVDADGKPIPGASVAAVVDVERGAFDGPLLLVVGQTDREGRFRLTARPLSPPEDDNLRVYAIVPGYAVCWRHLDIYRSANHATLHLQPDRPIHGRVVDSQGKPVAGTEVALFTVSMGFVVEEALWSELRFPASPSAPKPVPVVTNEQGEFVLRGVSEEMANYRAEIRGQRHAMQQIEFKTVGNKPRKITITAKPPQTMEGTLFYAETKKPVVGVEVAVISWVLDGAFMNRGVVKGRTDLQGHFRLTPASGEFFSVGVLDARSQFLHLLDLKPAEEVFNRKLDIVLPEGAVVRATAEVDTKTSAVSPIRGVSAESRGGTLLGRVVGPQGQTVANGFVVAPTAFTRAGGWGHYFELPIRDGWFAVPGLRAGKSYEVYLCDLRNHWGATGIVSADDRQPASFRLAPCGAATARLVDGLGKPCAHVSISSPPSDLVFNFYMMLTSASPLAGRADLGKAPVAASGFPCAHDPRYRELRTDANGRVTFPTLIPGAEYRVISSGEWLIRKNGLPVQLGEKADRDNAFVLSVPDTTQRQFRVRAGETLDLGEVHVCRAGNRLPPAGLTSSLGNPQELSQIVPRVDQLKAGVLAAVVAITAPGVGSGSGVVVSEDGYVMTCAHCLDKPGQKITVRFYNGTIAKAKVLGLCPTLDAGLVKIVEQDKKWPFVERGRSKSLQPGAWCVAIGYPGKYNTSVTPVTRIARIIKSTDHKLLFTGPMAACDSGGPVFDLDGRVVGVMQGMNIGTDRGIAVDVFTENWQRLIQGEVWQLIATEEDDL